MKPSKPTSSSLALSASLREKTSLANLWKGSCRPHTSLFQQECIFWRRLLRGNEPQSSCSDREICKPLSIFRLLIFPHLEKLCTHKYSHLPDWNMSRQNAVTMVFTIEIIDTWIWAVAHFGPEPGVCGLLPNEHISESLPALAMPLPSDIFLWDPDGDHQALANDHQGLSLDVKRHFKARGLRFDIASQKPKPYLRGYDENHTNVVTFK